MRAVPRFQLTCQRLQANVLIINHNDHRLRHDGHLMPRVRVIVATSSQTTADRASKEWPLMAPFYDGGCQGVGIRDAFEGAATLVGVNVVRPVGRSTLTPLARCRGVAAVPGPGVFPGVAAGGSGGGGGPGRGLVREPSAGVGWSGRDGHDARRGP